MLLEQPYICYLSILFLGCLGGVMVKDVNVAVLGAHAAFVGSTPTEVEIIVFSLFY